MDVDVVELRGFGDAVLAAVVARARLGFGFAAPSVVAFVESAAFFASGFLLNATGFDANLQEQAAGSLFLMRVFDIGVPILTSVIAILIIMAFPLTEQKAHQIREELEKRRGKPA